MSTLTYVLMECKQNISTFQLKKCLIRSYDKGANLEMKNLLPEKGGKYFQVRVISLDLSIPFQGTGYPW